MPNKHETGKDPVDELFEGIDGPLLRQQRSTLYELEASIRQKMYRQPCTAGKAKRLTIAITPEQLEHVTGLMGLLERFADIAHDTYGKACIIVENPCASCGHAEDLHADEEPTGGRCDAEGPACACEGYEEEK